MIFNLSYFSVSIAYSIANFLLSLIIISKTRKYQIAQFYFFLVNCLIAFGALLFVITKSPDGRITQTLENISLFLYALFPFFFIHFITLFVRKQELLNSTKLYIAIYTVGLISYIVLLLGYIPKPISEEMTISQSGYIFYVTWMSILFSIGIALLFDISRDFRQRLWKADFILGSFIFLLLILPGPFTDSIFFGVLKLSIEWYFYLCTFALLLAVYFIFRHKIISNPLYESFKAALNVMSDIFIMMDEGFKIEMIRGKAVTKKLGYNEKEMVGEPLNKFITPEEYLDEYKSFVQKKKMRESSFDADFKCKNGSKLPLNFSVSPLIVQDEIAGFVSIGRDMTERKQLEEELRQAQKMESIGTLAGGIAHDFNNILQIMMVNTSSLKRMASGDQKISQIIDINTSAIKRGSKLVQQILMFARKSEPQFAPLDLTVLIDDLIKFLSQTFPKNIRFITELDHQLPQILGDANQINQVFMNLCVNARDAMDGNGALSFKGTTIMGWELQKRFPSAKEDRYICISVTDTGHGMNEETRRRIFEPFFTTKEQGKGTGLGLSVVHGIITNHKGFIDVKSDVGLGTTFYLYFPVAVDTQKTIDLPAELLSDLPKGTETILFVEDETIVLQAISGMITAQGYKVITATDGFEAVETFKKMKNEIDLVIMDIGLPKMSGWDVFTEMKKEKDDVKVIIYSGYLDPKIKSEKTLAGIKEFIQKPYDPNQILRSVRKVLDT